MTLVLLTNNPLVKDLGVEIIKVDGDFRDVLLEARRMVHIGYRLYSHPLPASLKMFMSPSRSILLEEPSDSGVTPINSAQIIEGAIEKYDRVRGHRPLDTKNAKDYEVIDYDLIKECLV